MRLVLSLSFPTVSLAYAIVQRPWTQEVLGFDTFPPFHHQITFPVCVCLLTVNLHFLEQGSERTYEDI